MNWTNTCTFNEGTDDQKIVFGFWHHLQWYQHFWGMCCFHLQRKIMPGQMLNLRKEVGWFYRQVASNLATQKTWKGRVDRSLSRPKGVQKNKDEKTGIINGPLHGPTQSEMWISIQCHHTYMILFLALADGNGKWHRVSPIYDGTGKAVLSQMNKNVPSLENTLFYLSALHIFGHTSATLKMEPRFSETSVTTHNPAQCQNPEDIIWSTPAMKTWKPK
jgi:hypothetical protein